MTSMRKTILAVSTFLLALTSNSILTISSSVIDTINSPLLTENPTNKDLPSYKEDPKPVAIPKNKPAIQSWPSVSEVAIAGTTIVGSAALFASGGALIGAGYGWYTGAIGAGALSGASITGIVGAGCGLKVAVNNFNLDEKSGYSRFAYNAGIATAVGIVLGGATAGTVAGLLAVPTTKTIGLAVGIQTATGVKIGTAVSVATALGYFFPTLVQETENVLCSTKQKNTE